MLDLDCDLDLGLSYMKFAISQKNEHWASNVTIITLTMSPWPWPFVGHYCFQQAMCKEWLGWLPQNTKQILSTEREASDVSWI